MSWRLLSTTSLRAIANSPVFCSLVLASLCFLRSMVSSLVSRIFRKSSSGGCLLMGFLFSLPEALLTRVSLTFMKGKAMDGRVGVMWGRKSYWRVLKWMFGGRAQEPYRLRGACLECGAAGALTIGNIQQSSILTPQHPPFQLPSNKHTNIERSRHAASKANTNLLTLQSDSLTQSNSPSLFELSIFELGIFELSIFECLLGSAVLEEQQMLPPALNQRFGLHLGSLHAVAVIPRVLLAVLRLFIFPKEILALHLHITTIAGQS